MARTMTYNHWPMDSDKLLRFVFFLYCTSVGTLLVMLPWSTSWTMMIDHLPFSGLDLLKDASLRGALSGFGMVHLVWGLHDLSALLSQFSTPHDDRHTKISGDH